MVYWYLLPAITSEITRELFTKGIKKSQIARILGITPAAVSQYLKGKRGRGLKLDEKTKKAISELADEIARNASKGDTHVVSGICRACMLARSSGAVCSFHMELADMTSCSLCKNATPL